MATPFEKASGSPAPEGNGSAAPAAPAVAPAAVQPTSNVAPLTSGGAGAPARAATPGGAGGGLPRVGSDEPMRRPMSKRTNSLSDLSRCELFCLAVERERERKERKREVRERDERGRLQGNGASESENVCSFVCLAWCPALRASLFPPSLIWSRESSASPRDWNWSVGGSRRGAEEDANKAKRD